MIDILLHDNRFYLSGSRKMAEKYPLDIKINEKTDWDFSAQDSEAIRQWLSDNGFEKKDFKGKNYKCDQSIDLYEMDGIDVVLRKNIQTYVAAFDSISCYDYLTKCWKSSPYFNGDQNKIRQYMNAKYKEIENA